jgi:hypothetical protein
MKIKGKIYKPTEELDNAISVEEINTTNFRKQKRYSSDEQID